MRSARPEPSLTSAPDTRTAVTVLTGYSPVATEVLGRVLLVTDPGLLLLAYDRAGDATVRRRVRTATAVVEDADVPVAGDCLSCLVRADVLPALVRLGRHRPGADIVVALPAAVDPETLAAGARTVTDTLRFDSYVAVVDADRAIGDLTGTDSQAAVRPIEYADTVVLWDSPTLDRYDAARLSVLLHRLAPWATHISAGRSSRVDCTDLAARIRHSRRHDPAVPGILGRAMEGFPVGVHEPGADCGVTSAVFSVRRPFHPQRLHATLTALPPGVLRGRGQFWLASRPDTVIGYEYAGATTNLDDLGHWLAALPGQRWVEATDHRRLTADLDWDPYYGDRRTTLAFIGLDTDAAAVTGRLADCLLTDAEVADGEDAWRAYPDPFPA